MLYRTAGYRVCGERAVRVDILERLADIIRPALAWRAGAPGLQPAAAFRRRRLHRHHGDDVADRLLGRGIRLDPALARLPDGAAAKARRPTAAGAGSRDHPKPHRPRPRRPPPKSSPQATPRPRKRCLPKRFPSSRLKLRRRRQRRRSSRFRRQSPRRPRSRRLRLSRPPRRKRNPKPSQKPEPAAEAAAETTPAPATEAAATETAAAPPPDMIEVWRPGRPEGQRRPRHRPQRTGDQPGRREHRRPRAPAPAEAATTAPARRCSSGDRNGGGGSRRHSRRRRSQAFPRPAPAPRRAPTAATALPVPPGRITPTGRNAAIARIGPPRAAVPTNATAAISRIAIRRCARNTSRAATTATAATRRPIPIRRSPSWRRSRRSSRRTPRSGVKKRRERIGPPAHRQMAVARARGAHPLGGGGARRSGHVRLNGQRIDAPSRAVRLGDVVTVALDRTVRVLKVAGFAERRGAAETAQALWQDLSPPPPARPQEPEPAGARFAGRGRGTADQARAPRHRPSAGRRRGLSREYLPWRPQSLRLIEACGSTRRGSWSVG